ncbi:recombinase family protein [Pseudarthrobacter sp. NamB4]|uniref:recombinase family protein n=1 Tax=Pseudarthrobacter sp. NamB4 TaxID=2576837 RepID=UPI0010FDDA21|nr:recombinase family protein [Pseudarthrobacter sp. NamB4]TLM73129.1 recombinase family protein [Pseudarthrobacter sp. NamB4]
MKLGYARVSTTDQDARMQVAALEEAGVERERIFIDHMSGAKTAKERPGLTELLKYARDGDDVYCWRIDRLGRSLIDVLNTVDEMTKRGLRLHSIVDGVDPSTASVLRRSSRCLIPENHVRIEPRRMRQYGPHGLRQLFQAATGVKSIRCSTEAWRPAPVN